MQQVLIIVGTLLGFSCHSVYTADLANDATASCNLASRTYPQYAGWNIQSGQVNCQTVLQYQSIFCVEPWKYIDSTFNVSITEACCSCPSPSISPSPSTSPSPSPSHPPICRPTSSMPNLFCAYDASQVVFPVKISASSGALTSVIGGRGQAIFQYNSNFATGNSSFWAMTRCQSGASDSWIVNGIQWDIPQSKKFLWNEFGPLQSLLIPGLIKIEPREPNCEILAVYYGPDGHKLPNRLECGSNRGRGYLCATEMTLAHPVVYDQSQQAIVSLFGIPRVGNGKAVLEFKWTAALGSGSLWFNTKCPSGKSDSWFVNGRQWNIPHTANFTWHKFGVLNAASLISSSAASKYLTVTIKPREIGCFIQHAYFGNDQPDLADIESCPPVGVPKCPSEATFLGTKNLKGILSQDMSAVCSASLDSSDPCYAEAQYKWGSVRGDLWAKTLCNSTTSDSWYVNRYPWQLDVSSRFGWQRYGPIQCDNVVFHALDPDCRISMLYRGYGEPFDKSCNCPWTDQQMIVVEATGNGYDSIQFISETGERRSSVCSSGFLDATHLAQDSQGNIWVSDSTAGKIYRLPADCSTRREVMSSSKWPISRPQSIAFADDYTMYVADAARGLIFLLELTLHGRITKIDSTPFAPLFYTSIQVSKSDGLVYAASHAAIVYYDPTTQVVNTLVSPSLGVSGISEIAIGPSCPGLYFTSTASNQVWYCSDRLNGSTCQRFCRIGITDAVSCEFLNGPMGLALDCQCQLYVTSFSNGALIRYGTDGSAVVLSSRFVRPKSIMVKFNQSIYDTGCCHTPFPTPPIPTPEPTTDLIRLTGRCSLLENCFHGECVVNGSFSWCECASFAYGCECDLFSGTKPSQELCAADTATVTFPYLEQHQADPQECCADKSFTYFASGSLYRMKLTNGQISGPLELCASFVRVVDIQFAEDASIFVADQGAGVIARVAPGCGEVTIITSWSQDHIIATPQSLLLTQDGLYVADSGRNAILLLGLSPSYKVTWVQNTGISSQLVTSMALDKQTGRIFLVEQKSSIVVYDPSTMTRSNLEIGSDLFGITNVDVNPGCGLYFADSTSSQLWRCSLDDLTCSRFCTDVSSNDPASCAGVRNPLSVSVDCNCRVHVSNSGNNTVTRIDEDNGEITSRDASILPYLQGLKTYDGCQGVTPSASPSASFVPRPSPSPSIGTILVPMSPVTILDGQSLAPEDIGLPQIALEACTLIARINADDYAGSVCDSDKKLVITRYWLVTTTCGVASIFQVINVLGVNCP